MNGSCKQLLVHLDASSHGAKRLQAARELARQHGAALAAVYATMPSFSTIPYAPAVGPGVAAALVQAEAERRDRVRAVFDRQMQEPGPHASWSEIDVVPMLGALAEQAFCADLLVLGQQDLAEPGSDAGLPAGFVESLLAASGKPAIVIPYAGEPGSIGQTVAIGWKPAPEAARAVQAALPILQRAARVHVFSWGSPSAAPRGTALNLRGYLRLHGVEAEWHDEGPEPDFVGERLLSRAFEAQADLLVMGCYGHSRAREWVLGGASRTVLASMTLPVLMAH